MYLGDLRGKLYRNNLVYNYLKSVTHVINIKS